ncbi:hypothetical protein ACFLV5_00420 [Chloroflexota bacterium]
MSEEKKVYTTGFGTPVDNDQNSKTAGSNIVEAVFEGGGVMRIGLVGALSVAEERGYNWINVVGIPIEAIVAPLFVLVKAFWNWRP